MNHLSKRGHTKGSAYWHMCEVGAKELREACMSGQEFPDAAHRIARKYNVGQRHIEELYDSQEDA